MYKKQGKGLFKILENWNILDLGLLKIEIWSENLLYKYQIVHHYDKVPLSPLAE